MTKKDLESQITNLQILVDELRRALEASEEQAGEAIRQREQLADKISKLREDPAALLPAPKSDRSLYQLTVVKSAIDTYWRTLETDRRVTR